MRRIAAAAPPGVLPPPRPGVGAMPRHSPHRQPQLLIVSPAARSSRDALLLQLPPQRNQCRHRSRTAVSAAASDSPFFIDQAPPSPSSPVDVIDVQADPIGVKEDGTTPEHWSEELKRLDPKIEEEEEGEGDDGFGGDANTASSSSTSSSKNQKLFSLASLRSLLSLSDSARVLQNSGRARILRRFFSRVKEINALEPEISALTDEGLRLEAALLRSRALGEEEEDGEEEGEDGEGDKKKKRRPEPLDNLLPRAFALVREASRRTLGLRPYDVQLVGAMVLHEGLVAEMRTGEGKTLVAALAAFLNALTGKGVMVVTVNDYLAKRDREWVGKPLELLGLTTAVVTDAVPHNERAAPLAADVCWLTAKQLGFTYLRDNTTPIPGTAELALRRPLHFAIVDEVDSVLIDDCQVPLVISGGPLRGDESKYEVAQQLFEGKEEFTWELDREGGGTLRKKGAERGETRSHPSRSRSRSSPFFPERFFEAESDPLTGELKPGASGDYVHDRRSHRVSLTTAGAAKAARRLAEEGLLSIPGLETAKAEQSSSDGDEDGDDSKPPPPPSDFELGAALWQGEDPWGPYINVALKANAEYQRDVHYILRNGEARIVDPETGRVLPDSRWTDGLHQAVEAKEGLVVRGACATLGQITFQALFRKFERVGGMSGTAVSEAEEFHEVYGLGVIPVPPHRPPQRVDHPAKIFLTRLAKEAQIAMLIAEAKRHGRPVLLGTRSVADSERLSRALDAGLADARLQLANDYPALAWEVIPEEEREGYDYLDGFQRVRRGQRFVPKRIDHRLLNARPELVAEEAAIVAQAGLPGAVTIATSMAGRGTDILLGGNAKGLAAAKLLKDLGYLLGGRAAEVAEAVGGGEKGREAARAQEPQHSVPAAAAAAAAAGSSSGKENASSILTLEDFPFPAFASGAIERVRACLYASEDCQLPPAPETGWEGGSNSEGDGDGHLSGDGEGRDEEPLFMGPQRIRAERARADIEAALLVAEQVRAAFKLQQKATGKSVYGDGKAVFADASHAFALSGPVVRKFARDSPFVASLDKPRQELVIASLVLWTWFDEVCAVLSNQVVRKGGLMVIVCSALDSQRVLAQLVGRCGRQGDPGETHVVVELRDVTPPSSSDAPHKTSLTERLWELADQPVLAGAVPKRMTAKTFKDLRRRAEESAGSARRHVKEVDEVMGVFRDHVYALRRGLMAGDERKKRALLRGVLCSFAADLASVATQEGRLPPEEWDVEALVREARRLEREGRRGQNVSKGAGGEEALGGLPEAGGDFPAGFVPGVSDPALYPPSKFAEDVQFSVDTMERASRVWTPRARVFRGASGAAGGGGGGGDGDGDGDGDQDDLFADLEDEAAPSYAASAARAAEALRGAAVAAAAEALRLGGGSGEGGESSFLLDDATRTFLLRPGRSLRGFSALAGEFGGKEVATDASDSSKAGKGKGGRKATTTTATTRDRNLVASRALALLSARELVRAASSLHPGLSYVLEAHFGLIWGFDNRVFSQPSPTDVGAETARAVLDEGWGDFLPDAKALEAAVTLRVFSAQLNPLDEFKLEAGAMFAQLLRRFRARVAAELLGGPELIVEPDPGWAQQARKQGAEEEEERKEKEMWPKKRAETKEDKRKEEEEEEEEEEGEGAAAAARGEGARAEEEGGGGGGGGGESV